MRLRYVFSIYLILIAVAWPRLAFGETETDYLAVFLEGKKVGYAIESREVTAGKVTTTEKVSMTLNRAAIPVNITVTETCIETVDGKPLGFEAVQDLSLMTMKLSGTVEENGTVNVITSTMGAEQKSSFKWPDGALMAEGMRLLELEKGLKEGTSYSAKIFSPGIMKAVDTAIRIGTKQDVDLLGRVVNLREVVTTLEMPGAGQLVMTSYVDENLRMQKTIMPMMGMQVEMIACTKEFALGENDVLELVEKMFLTSPQPLENVGSAKSITYHISPASDANNFLIPSTDNQSVLIEKDGRVIVTVEPVAAEAGVRFPYNGEDKAIQEATKPTRFLQSDNKAIIDLADRAVGKTKDAAEAAKRIEAFVARYIDKKGLSVGYASATEVAASKQGDCSEFAVLTAAMCRAVGIPAEVVVGIAYVKNFAGLKDRFGGHAWVRVYVGSQWVGLDAAFKSSGLAGYDPGHIALAYGNGDPVDFFNLVSTLGRFKIEKVIVDTKK